MPVLLIGAVGKTACFIGRIGKCIVCKPDKRALILRNILLIYNTVFGMVFFIFFTDGEHHFTGQQIVQIIDRAFFPDPSCKIHGKSCFYLLQQEVLRLSSGIFPISGTGSCLFAAPGQYFLPAVPQSHGKKTGRPENKIFLRYRLSENIFFDRTLKPRLMVP